MGVETMSTINKRMCADLEGEFVVFLIGMRINKPWKVGAWWPVFWGMGKMLAELGKQTDLGLLHARGHTGFPNLMIVQYWRSFEALEAFAKSRELSHLPAWQAFNKRTGSNGDVGIWHETYRVRPGDYECIYNNMPAYGAGRAGKLVEAVGRREGARGRMAKT